MTDGTVIRHARRLRRNCEAALAASRVGVSRIGGAPLVSDLPEFTVATIAVWSQADYLATALREWLTERGVECRVLSGVG